MCFAARSVWEKLAIGSKTAMQTESFDMRRDLAAEAHAAEGAMMCLVEQSAGEADDIGEHCQPRNATLTGLAVAIPISLALWTVIVLLLWLLLR